jgi:signal transduction histidine kinase
MNKDLENIKSAIEQSDEISESEKDALLNSIKAVEKELTIIEFKLERTEKVKRTTSVLLEETIDELEKKRADVEQANAALKQSLEELKSTQAQLIQSEKMASLGELTAGIAHEIQNPLNFVNNFSEVNRELVDELKDAITSNDQEEIQLILKDLEENEEKIRHHGKRAEGIVKGMLQHSRTSQGEKELTDINILADEYLRLAYHGLRAKDKSFKADFKCVFDESLPKIKLIPQDIGRVLLNLINNAFYAVNRKSKSGIHGYKPEVIVSTRVSLSEGSKKEERIEILVKDNGPGIPDEIKEKIFQPFFTTKPTGSGTGLGLSLSYDIIKAHGGDIKLESHQVGEKEKAGTEFIICLPFN